MYAGGKLDCWAQPEMSCYKLLFNLSVSDSQYEPYTILHTSAKLFQLQRNIAMSPRTLHASTHSPLLAAYNAACQPLGIRRASTPCHHAFQCLTRYACP